MPQRSIKPGAVAPASVLEVINGTIQRTHLTSMEVAERHLQSRRNDGTPRSRVYLLQGLWPHWVTIFESYFRINATFLESHMRRRPYQHHSWTRTVQSGAFSVSYPEIVRWIPPSSAVSANGAASPGDQNQSRMKVDALFDPIDCPLEGLTHGKNKRVGALLNHAASWNRIHRNEDIDYLLLLDDEVWTAESSGIRKDFHKNDNQGQTTTPDDGDLKYPCGSLEILSCSLEVLICQTLQVAKKLPKDMYELNTYLHEVAVAKWEAYFDLYSAFLRRFSKDIFRSSGVGHELVAQQTKVCEEAQDHIEWNMRVEVLNSILTDKDPMAKKFRIDNWKRLQRNCNTVGKPVEFANRDQSESSVIPSSQANVQEDISKQEADVAQQSVNRLAYLGGIFLPFSIVAAIFSMGQEFAAGMPLFYVYWVISLPLSLAVIATIYADTIRRLTPTQLGMKMTRMSEMAVGSDTDTNQNYAGFEAGSCTNDDRPLGWLGAYATVLRKVLGYR